jgi:hypothetical protein
MITLQNKVINREFFFSKFLISRQGGKSFKRILFYRGGKSRPTETLISAFI